ncbi:MAG: arylsulfatase [Planctomycetales bacterium]|nr:arylsulfatase [Planctomycetales bacterium]
MTHQIAAHAVLSVAFLLTQTLDGPVLQAAPTDRPNIVLILADDMGWGDPQCYQPASKIPTPNLDRLAGQGVRFTDAHTPSSVCTPTRYTLLTGRYCWRTSLTKGVLDGFAPPLIQPNEDTLASMLKRHGYRTACIGKWHLGMQWYDTKGIPIERREVGVRFRPGQEVDYDRDITGGPVDIGFDSYFGISASLDMAPYVYIRDRRVETRPTEFHDEIPDTIFLNGVPGVESPGFDVHDVLPRFGDQAIKVIESQANRDQPLFLYMPLNSPHLPVAPSAFSKGKSDAGDYGDFVWETDYVVGRVLDALQAAEMTENTLVIFTSDNGGLWHWWNFRADDDGGKTPITPRGQYVKNHSHQSNAHLRGTKADAFEGGHRVPFIVRWPAKIAAGQVVDSTIELTDVYATIAEILGDPVKHESSGMDSFSLLPLLTGTSKTSRPFAVHHSLAGIFALRLGDWKMIEGRGSGGFTRPNRINPKPGEPEGQLYHLADDPQERSNLWADHSDQVTLMQEMLERVRNTSSRIEATKAAF